MMNKKGASLSGWTEVALFSVLISILLIIIVGNMNILHDQNKDATFGFSSNSTLTGLKDYQSTLESSIKEGESSTSSITGLSLSSTWEMIKAGINIVWDFLIGNWVRGAVKLIRLPTDVGIILQILYVLSVGFIAIKLLLKVKP